MSTVRGKIRGQAEVAAGSDIEGSSGMADRVVMAKCSQRRAAARTEKATWTIDREHLGRGDDADSEVVRDQVAAGMAE